MSSEEGEGEGEENRNIYENPLQEKKKLLNM